MRSGRVVLLVSYLLMGSGTTVAAEPFIVEPAPAPPTNGPLAEWVDPAVKPPPSPWSGGADLGIAGAEGNSKNFKFRSGLNTKYERDPHFLKVDILYSYTKANSEVSENRLLAKERYERRLADSPWSWFLASEVDYDQFKAFDVRVAAHTGLSYTWIKDDNQLFKTRAGAGGSREIGGPSNDIKPELLFGFDLERKLTQRIKLCASLDYFPNVIAWSDFRVESRVAVDLLIDPEWNLNLRLGLLDRYDSTPEGRSANDIEYFATLLWTF